MMIPIFPMSDKLRRSSMLPGTTSMSILTGTPRTTVDALSRPRKFPTIVCVRSTCVSAKAGVHQNDIRQDCIPYRGVGFKTTLCERQNDREKSLEAPHRLIRLRPGEASVLRPPHQPQRVHHPSTMPPSCILLEFHHPSIIHP